MQFHEPTGGRALKTNYTLNTSLQTPIGFAGPTDDCSIGRQKEEEEEDAEEEKLDEIKEKKGIENTKTIKVKGGGGGRG